MNKKARIIRIILIILIIILIIFSLYVLVKSFDLTVGRGADKIKAESKTVLSKVYKPLLLDNSKFEGKTLPI